jgi:outer membrane protein
VEDMKIIYLLFCSFFTVFSGGGLCAQEAAYPDLSLDECITQTLASNPELAYAREASGQREALLRSAKKDLYPSLSANYSYTHQPDSFYFPAEDEFSYGVTAEQPLYRGKALVTGVKQAKILLNASVQGIHRNINDLVFNVYAQYFELLQAEKLEEEAQQAVVRLKSHLKDSQAFFDAGLIPKNDLLETEVELAQGEQDLVDAQNETYTARARLNILMQRPITAPLTIQDCCDDDDKEFNWEDVLEGTVNKRPEVVQAKLAVEMAEKGVIMKKAPFLPKVTLSASYDKRGDDPGGSPTEGWPSENKMVKATASWKVWTWFKGSDETTAARKEVKKAEKEVARIINEVTLEARIAFLHLEQAAKRIKVSETAIKHAEENYRINQARYQSQVATSTDVLDSQTLLTKAMSNYYNSVYGYRIAMAAVDRASGFLAAQYTK